MQGIFMVEPFQPSDTPKLVYAPVKAPGPTEEVKAPAPSATPAMSVGKPGAGWSR